MTNDNLLGNCLGDRGQAAFIYEVKGEILKKSYEDVTIVFGSNSADTQIIHCQKNLSACEGLYFEEEIYGFNVLVNAGEDKRVEEYPTSKPIVCIRTEEDVLKVYEKSKDIPWTFSGNGTLINDSDGCNLIIASNQANAKLTLRNTRM